MISTGGIWRAQDLLATLHDSTLRGLALGRGELRYVAPGLAHRRDGGREVGRLYDQGARLRDGHGPSAL